MRETGSQVPEAFVNRGVGWQAAGFTLTGIVCLVILKRFEGSEFWPYQWFETATVDLYWSTIVPLAFLFDGVRKMFETAKAIREAQKARMVKRAREKEQERIQKVLKKHGVVLPPEVVEAAFGNGLEDDF